MMRADLFGQPLPLGSPRNRCQHTPPRRWHVAPHTRPRATSTSTPQLRRLPDLHRLLLERCSLHLFLELVSQPPCLVEHLHERLEQPELDLLHAVELAQRRLDSWSKTAVEVGAQLLAVAEAEHRFEHREHGVTTVGVVAEDLRQLARRPAWLEPREDRKS